MDQVVEPVIVQYKFSGPQVAFFHYSTDILMQVLVYQKQYIQITVKMLHFTFLPLLLRYSDAWISLCTEISITESAEEGVLSQWRTCNHLHVQVQCIFWVFVSSVLWLCETAISVMCLGVTVVSVIIMKICFLCNLMSWCLGGWFLAVLWFCLQHVFLM